MNRMNAKKKNEPKQYLMPRGEFDDDNKCDSSSSYSFFHWKNKVENHRCLNLLK